MARFLFALHMLDLIINDWRNVLFKIEISFCLDSNDWRVRVLRQPGHHYHDYVIAEHEENILF